MRFPMSCIIHLTVNVTKSINTYGSEHAKPCLAVEERVCVKHQFAGFTDGGAAGLWIKLSLNQPHPHVNTNVIPKKRCPTSLLALWAVHLLHGKMFPHSGNIFILAFLVFTTRLWMYFLQLKDFYLLITWKFSVQCNKKDQEMSCY